MTSTTSPGRTLTGADVSVGDAVTPMSVKVTTTLIVAGAIASRDYMPVHHDKDFATAQGSPDIFLNILTTNGLCVKFLHQWAGPEAMVAKLSVRLGVPAFPNSDLDFTGTVTAVEPDGDGHRVEIDLEGVNNLGKHVYGTAALHLLDGPAR
ncbi:MaoC/PaaZ C-terminal domain-containing protein [uncultured Williamsia sp.]|uniref:MaoC/PaaZ C-terminal domain-containing protein n=1 Tax=uncultured Williamsia sp. TaxID=259311 RepID=UPI00261CC90B|nr:MaoC/PaaZ C-terminal domain-containing protein [uncultured Williamsia sp.]